MKLIHSIFTLLAVLLFSCTHTDRKQDAGVYQFNKGMVFHTLYSITYNYPTDINNEIMAELDKFDASLSMFNPQSTISRINNNEPEAVPDQWMVKVFETGQQISKETDGAFDMTVAPLVNAWGFGFKKRENITQEVIDSLKEFVGYQKVRLTDGKIYKDDPRLIMDASAIAKGFSCDIIAQLFDKKGIDNYMIEIGGEIVTKGLNPKGKLWNIGISNPREDSIASTDLAAVLSLNNIALATSGNYRNFYYQNGKKYAHTINPATGYPVEHSLLSATVLAKECMIADALATSFMVMGLEKSLEFVKRHHDIHAYFIYSGEDGKDHIVYSEGMEQYIQKTLLTK